jgi:N-acetylneuraminic acid mutarotase
MKKIFLVLLFFTCISAEAQVWTKKANFPAGGRRAPATFTINGKAYLVSGEGGNVYLPEVWEYDQTYDLWTRKKDFPGAPRFSASAFVINNRAYVMGGTSDAVTVCHNDLWEYNPSNDSWVNKGNLPMPCRDLAIAFSSNGKGYYGTGRLFSNLNQQLADLWEYDPTTNSWTQMPFMPGGGRANALVFEVHGNIYMGYGFGTQGALKSDLYHFDPLQQVWTAKNPAGMAVAAPAYFSIGNFGFIATGSINQFLGESKEAWAYRAATNTWQQIDSLPATARVASDGFAIGSSGYVIFGANNAVPYITEFYELNLPVSFLGVGLNEVSANGRMQVYPNPAKDIINLQQNDINADTQIKDVFGKVLLSGTGNRIDISVLPPGLYIITAREGSSRWQGRFVKAD